MYYMKVSNKINKMQNPNPKDVYSHRQIYLNKIMILFQRVRKIFYQ